MGGPACRVCDITLGEQYVYGAQCCPVVHISTTPAVAAAATVAVPPPSPVVVPHPQLPIAAQAVVSASAEVPHPNLPPVVTAVTTTPATAATTAAAAIIGANESGIKDTNVVHVVHHRADENIVGIAATTAPAATISATSSSAASDACDPNMPCSKVETVRITPPVLRASVPAGFFSVRYTADQVRCNDIQFANHCMYPGKFAFLRSPSQRYQDFALDGVYGGRFCQAQCEPRFEVDGDKHCVCVCTVPPSPIAA